MLIEVYDDDKCFLLEILPTAPSRPLLEGSDDVDGIRFLPLNMDVGKSRGRQTSPGRHNHENDARYYLRGTALPYFWR